MEIEVKKSDVSFQRTKGVPSADPVEGLLHRRFRILFVEDSEADVELTIRQIVEAGYEVIWERVDSPGGVTAQLEMGGWDVVLCDYAMPGFSGMEALRMVREAKGDLPFIFVSGTMGEDTAVLAMKAGAHDYVLKGNLRRLPPAIAREVAEAEERQRRRRAEANLAENEAQLRAMFEMAAIGIVQADPQTSRWLRVNPRMSAITGFSEGELLAMKVGDLAHPDERAAEKRMFRRVVGGEGADHRMEMRYLRKDGATAWVSVNMTLIRSAEGQPLRAIAMIEDITDRVRSAESRARLVTAVEQSAEAIVITDPEGTIQYVNPAFETVSGYSAAESLGRNPRIVKSGIHGTDFYRVMWETLKRGEVWKGLLINRRKDGTLYEEEATISPVFDGSGRMINYVAVKHDITERRRSEMALRESEERFRELAMNAKEIFYIVDRARRRLIYVSPAFEAIFGRACHELYADPVGFLQMLHPDDRPAAVEQMERARRGEETEAEFRIVTPDGSVRWVRDRSFPIYNTAGTFYRIAGLAEDITERKQLEAQFLRAQRVESIGQLASGIAHDFNNILTPILMLIPMIRRSVSEEKLLGYLNTIETSANRGAQVIRQILSFSRGMQGERVPVQTRHLFGEIEGIIRETFPRSVRLETDVPAHLWPVQGEAVQLHQVLMNLCVNARDAMPEGGQLKLSAENLLLDPPGAKKFPGLGPGRYVIWRITDTGTGIPPEELERIFDLFYTTKEIGKGSGLGLSTVLGIIRGHDGWIDVMSRIGGGTEFRILLPAAEESIEIASQPEELPSPRGGGERVLVVDDEEPLRTIVSGVLEHLGYQVVLAGDGAEAIRIYSERQSEIGVVLTDMDMPPPDGATVVRAVRGINPRAKIVRMSGHVYEDEGDFGGALFLQKPFTPQQLDSVLRAALGA